MFNEGRYWERVQAGELIAVTLREGSPDPANQQPAGTKSVVYVIRTREGEDLVHAHAYVKPDGAIGASGRPDPKRIYKDGTVYRAGKQKDRPPEPLNV